MACPRVQAKRKQFSTFKVLCKATRSAVIPRYYKFCEADLKARAKAERNSQLF